MYSASRPSAAPEIVLCLRVRRMCPDPLLSQIDGPLHVGSKLCVDLRWRFGQVDARAGERAKVVIHRDGTPPEKDVQPEDACQRAVRRRIVRRERHGSTKECQRPV